MLRNYSNTYKRATHNVNVVCGLLFFIFSVSYLLFFQKVLAEELLFVILGKVTVESLYIILSGIIILLYLLYFFTRKILSINGIISSFAYFPSFFVLGVITSSDKDMFYGNIFNTRWIWLFPAVIIAFILFVRVIRWLFRIDVERERGKLSLVNWNISIFFLQMLLTLYIGNTNVMFHYELNVDNNLRNGNAKEVLEIGYKSLQNTKTLNVLRNMALLKNDSIASMAFEFPQDYGSSALLFGKEKLSVGNGYVYSLLGNRRIHGESVEDYLKRLSMHNKSNKKIADYYLVSLLLDKKLAEFVNELPHFYKIDKSLPKHYQEALLTYSLKTETPFTLNEKMKNEYADFMKGLDEVKTSEEKAKFVRNQYGKTYMWYYLNK